MNTVKRLQKMFQSLRIDAFLVTNQINKAYLTDFDGDGVVLVTQDECYIITDARYQAILARQTQYQFRITRHYLDVVAQLVEQLGISVLAFEDTLPYYWFETIDELMVSDIVPMSQVIERLREVKTGSEVNQLKNACELTVTGFNQLLPLIKPGVTEKWVADQLDAIMRRLGASKASFDTIIASGQRAAFPHGAATEKQLALGEMITIDFGYYVNGMTSDLTRTVSLGQPNQQLKTIYPIVQEAQQRIIANIRPGVTGQALDTVGRQFITDAGYGDAFNHGTGHGIGLDIHEGPAISTRSEDQLVIGNVITVEPGIYLNQLGGVRIEDDILVTSTGYQVLTASNTDLIIL